MLLPSTYLAALLLFIFSMVCWGSWANTLKMLGRWRFELFYYDYSLGVVVCAVVAAFTLGTLRSQEPSFQDDLLLYGSYHNMAYNAGAGMIFNLANLLLAGAISVAGMAVALPIGIGLAAVIGVVMNYIASPQPNPVVLFSGVFLVLLAIVINASSYRAHVNAQRAAARKSAPTAPRSPGTRVPKAGKGIALSVAGGILLGLSYPVLAWGTTGEIGMGPYGAALFFSVGVLVSTFIYAPFFLNFPVQGKPLEFSAYFKGTSREHFLGLLGGVVWMAGELANFTAARAPVAVQVEPSVSDTLARGAILVSALWGLLVWREFRGATVGVKALLAAMLVLFAAGLAMVAIAPLAAR
jgi:glucose uptake protein